MPNYFLFWHYSIWKSAGVAVSTPFHLFIPSVFTSKNLTSGKVRKKNKWDKFIWVKFHWAQLISSNFLFPNLLLSMSVLSHDWPLSTVLEIEVNWRTQRKSNGVRFRLISFSSSVDSSNQLQDAVVRDTSDDHYGGFIPWLLKKEKSCFRQTFYWYLDSKDSHISLKAQFYNNFFTVA